MFDLDGTIVDTEAVEYGAVQAMWAEHGLDYPPQRWAAVIGVSWSPAWLDELSAAVGDGFDAEAVRQRARAHKHTGLAQLVPRPGIVELFAEAAGAAIPVAIASNSPEAWVDERLRQLGLRDQVRFIAAVDTVSEPKPAPAPYLEACAALGADPSRSLAFEDSSTGVASAVAAGLFTVACPHLLTSTHDLSAADLIVDTLAGFQLTSLHEPARPRRS